MTSAQGGHPQGPGEYVTDVPYVRTFARDLSPARLRLVAALNGFPQPAARAFDYCELGCGTGDTIVALAAAYPDSRFVGVDFNAEHVEFARSRAAEGGLRNVQFLDKDFEDLSGTDLFDFDFLCAHGVLSWVGPAKRKAIIEVAARRLKPGGLFYVGYNALPGWASIEPLRRLIADRAAAVTGDSLERAREAVDFAKRVRDGGAAYFANNPAAREMLVTMEKAGLPYVAHEYMNAHWAPMYFAEVAQMMAGGELYFAGQLPLHLNYRDIAIPPALLPLFKQTEGRIEFETLKDYALDQYFRCDVYVKGRAQRSDATTQDYFASTPFGAFLDDGPVQRQVRLPHYVLEFTGPLFDALIPALAERAMTAEGLAATPELGPFGARSIQAALLRLALAGVVSPMLEPTLATATHDDRPFRVPSAYNRMVLAQPFDKTSPIVLAAPAAGTAIPLTKLEAVGLRLLTEVPKEKRREWIGDLFRTGSFRLTVKDRPVADAEELVRVLEGEVERVRRDRAGKLVALGVLA